MKLAKILFLLLIISITTSCKNDEEESSDTRTGYYYDPRIPFGTIDFSNMAVRNVTNLTADTSISKKIKLSWTVPPLYTTMNYKIAIYKRRISPPGFEIVCPKPVGDLYSLCPNDDGNVSSLYKVADVTGTQWVDENTVDSNGDEVVNVIEGSEYTYWVFVYLVDQDKYSTGVKIVTNSRDPGDNFEFPVLTEFWKKKRFSYGIDPAIPTDGSDPINSLYTLSIGPASLGNFKGGVAVTEGGNVMYVADSGNNRVVIYHRAGAINCETIEDQFEKQACQLQYLGQPLTARNVLGQSNGSYTAACGSPTSLPQSECLSNPTRVKIINNKLFISDSGNNRIVVHDGLPLNGCIAEAVTGQVTPLDCTPNWVIGKAGLMDTSTYSVEVFGDSALNFPTDVVAKDGELYIADTNNNRVVKVSNYANRDMFNCTVSTWSTSLCKFSGVLGQPDYFTKENFKDLVASRLAESTPFYVIDQNGLKDTIVDPYKSYLKRHFRKPSKIMFSKDNKLLIAANEEFEAPNALGGRSSLYGRILIFNNNPIAGTPTCNLATYATGACDANDVIGSKAWDKLETVSTTGATSYNQLQYGMYGLSDFELIEVDGETDDDPSTEMLIALDVMDNSLHVWSNWLNKLADGYPRTGRVVDPQGVFNEETQQSLPDLESICSIKFDRDQNYLYITDCGKSKVHEISLLNLGI